MLGPGASGALRCDAGGGGGGASDVECFLVSLEATLKLTRGLLVFLHWGWLHAACMWAKRVCRRECEDIIEL